MRALLVALGWGFILFTAVPFLDFRHWWVRAFEFPRPQAAFLGLLLLAALLFTLRPIGLREAVLVSLVGVAIVLQAWYYFPYSPLAPTTVAATRVTQADRLLTVMTANVYQENRDYQGLLEVVRQSDPDLFFVVETDQGWIDALEPLRRLYPHVIEVPLDNTYGLALYSRRALEEAEVRYLIQDDVPSLKALVRLPGGEALRFYGLHPRPPVPNEAETSTPRDAELLQVAREIGEIDEPAIVLGDLNDVAWSYTSRRMLRLGYLLDPRHGRGLFATFPARAPGLLRWPLDHLFHTRHFSVTALQCLPRFGSDHLAVFAAIHLDPAAQGLHDVPEPDVEDHQVAEEVIEEAKDEEAERTGEGEEVAPDGEEEKVIEGGPGR